MEPVEYPSSPNYRLNIGISSLAPYYGDKPLDSNETNAEQSEESCWDIDSAVAPIYGLF